MKVKLLAGLLHGGKDENGENKETFYKSGSTINFSDEQGQKLVDSGVAEKVVAEEEFTLPADTNIPEGTVVSTDDGQGNDRQPTPEEIAAALNNQ